MPNLAIKTAICTCDKGATPNALVAPTVPGVKVGGQVVATIADVFFPPAPFGVCAITQKPCTYAPASPWSTMVPTVAFGGLPPLVQGAKLPCVIGGIIDVISVIQSTVDTGKTPPWEIPQETLKALAMNASLKVVEEKWALVEREVGKLPDTSSNAGVKKYVGGGAKVLKKGVPLVSPALDVHAIATNEGEARERAIGSAIGGAAGGAAGAAIFGTLGSVVPVAGTGAGIAVGSVVGSTVGSVVGGTIAPTVADGIDKAGDIAGDIKDKIPDVDLPDIDAPW